MMTTQATWTMVPQCQVWMEESTVIFGVMHPVEWGIMQVIAHMEVIEMQPINTLQLAYHPVSSFRM